MLSPWAAENCCSWCITHHKTSTLHFGFCMNQTQEMLCSLKFLLEAMPIKGKFQPRTVCESTVKLLWCSARHAGDVWDETMQFHVAVGATSIFHSFCSISFSFTQVILLIPEDDSNAVHGHALLWVVHHQFEVSLNMVAVILPNFSVGMSSNWRWKMTFPTSRSTGNVIFSIKYSAATKCAALVGRASSTLWSFTPGEFYQVKHLNIFRRAPDTNTPTQTRDLHS